MLKHRWLYLTGNSVAQDVTTNLTHVNVHRYEFGLGGVVKDVETALLYLTNPTIVASDTFQAYGAQPIVESDRINDQTVRDVMIWFTIVRSQNLL
jgi:hypothetical protein